MPSRSPRFRPYLNYLPLGGCNTSLQSTLPLPTFKIVVTEPFVFRYPYSLLMWFLLMSTVSTVRTKSLITKADACLRTCKNWHSNSGRDGTVSCGRYCLVQLSRLPCTACRERCGSHYCVACRESCGEQETPLAAADGPNTVATAAAPLSCAVCVVGQLARLELESKVQHTLTLTLP